MICLKCKNKIIMSGFSEGVCSDCGELFSCSHTPADKICGACIKKDSNEDRCKMCGSYILKDCGHKCFEVIPTIATLYKNGDTYHLRCKDCGIKLKKYITKVEILEYKEYKGCDLDTTYVKELNKW